ncbi:PAS domain-containing sensor histidine kinase [Desulfoferrobacter suflitae]|uniref:PAS domain-containing sensor histidine kinase n=1 Tax=Desulfoferrobacter suflitae TaxID=2865782 RepID=UPI0021645DA8|nr:PAS domain-containing sensor histidine kinase [Desulfoferrobacter suflitae]MCK8600686.1 PAS domain-containing sensor histidine kinase [Desulfoferrobacter suflitae]
MTFVGRLNFQTKIILITFAMVMLIVLAGGIAIDRVVVPAMGRDVQEEAWKIANGIVEQVREVVGEDQRTPSKSQLESLLSLIFNVRAKLLYVELLGQDGETVYWMGSDEYREGGQSVLLEQKETGNLLMRRLASYPPIYEVFRVGQMPRTGLAISALRVGVSARSVQRLSRQLFKVLFFVTFFILIISFFLIRWFSDMITRPVSRLLRMTNLLARGQLEDAIREVERAPPCLQKLQSSGAKFLGKSHIPACCPVLGPSTVARPSTAFQKDSETPCDLCEAFKRPSGDELSKLLLAFHYMAVNLKAYQEELRQRYEFEERLCEACPDGIMANDMEGKIILYNEGAQRLIGYDPAEVLNKLSVREIYPPGEPHKIKKALLIDDYGGPGVLLDYTTELIRKDGTHIPIRLSATILYDGVQEIAVVGYFHDLSELHEHMHALVSTNERLNKANRELARLNHRYLEMLGFVTHELKSPIANSYMSANALRQEIFGSLAPEQSIMVEAICRNLDQSMEMIRHYLDLSRIEKDEMQVNPQPTRILSEVIDPVVKGLAGAILERGVALATEVPGDLVWTLDPELFRGVVTNLMNNALKYGEKSGSIRISAEDLGDRMRLEVWNSGPGISPEDQSKLFQKFQRLQSSRQSSVRGTGLGLFITKTIVERHGGNIRVESREGEWANFIIELPKENPPQISRHSA